MDELSRQLIAAFGMGSIGAAPVGAGDDESRAGEDGLASFDGIVRYGQALRALAAVDAVHPELGIRARLEQLRADLDGGGDVEAALAAVEEMLAQAKPHLPK